MGISLSSMKGPSLPSFDLMSLEEKKWDLAPSGGLVAANFV